MALRFDKHLDNYKWNGSVCPFNYRVIINGIKDMLYLNHFNNSFLVVDSTTQWTFLCSGLALVTHKTWTVIIIVNHTKVQA